MPTLAAAPRTPAPGSIPLGRFLQSFWPERLAALLAVAGVLISVFLNFHVHTWQQSGSDFKTMYASSTALAHGLDAYNFGNIASVFQRNAIAEPANWYGHAPVYPPFTLALLAPFAALPMVAAVYLWTVLSGIVFALALASLARFAAERFALSRPWCLLLIALAAAFPLLSFALEMGNVSVIASAFCLLAVTAREPSSPWPRATALAVALLLKPHLALWVALALLFLRHRPSRRIAARAFAIAAAAVALFAVVLALRHTLTTQLHGYLAVLHAEVSGGSMDAGRRDLVGVAAQITSLESLTGYWLPHLHFFDLAVVLAAFLALAAASLRLRSPGPSMRLALVAAWSSLGLLATYHRAHDGIVLLVLLPMLLAKLRTSWRSPQPWLIFALAFAMSSGPTWETWQWLAAKPVIGPAAELLLYRQAPVATLLLACLLVGTVVHAAFARSLSDRMTGQALRSLPA